MRTYWVGCVCVSLLEGDPQGALLLGEPDLLLCVEGEGVWGGQPVRLGLETVLVCDVAKLHHTTVIQRVPEQKWSY